MVLFSLCLNLLTFNWLYFSSVPIHYLFIPCCCPLLVTDQMSSALLPAGLSYGEAVSWMDSTEEEVAVWITMIKNPNHWVDATLPVRTDLAHWS